MARESHARIGPLSYSTETGSSVQRRRPLKKLCQVTSRSWLT